MHLALGGRVGVLPGDDGRRGGVTGLCIVLQSVGDGSDAFLPQSRNAGFCHLVGCGLARVFRINGI